MPDHNITVFGAYGHTGKFVVRELLDRGLTPILSGRDLEKLCQLGDNYPALEKRAASIEDAASLDAALSNSTAVINCAGPFLDTAKALVEAAIRSGIHYLDVSAEQRAVLEVYREYAEAARESDIVCVPAAAFYGGLSDLLVTAAAAEWTDVDEIEISTALDSWCPTKGTRLTGERNAGQRNVFTNGSLELQSDPPPRRMWEFQKPFGNQPMVELPLTETITISRHIRTTHLRCYLNLTPLDDLKKPESPPPQIERDGRSAQVFLMEVVVRKGDTLRTASAAGRDIYYISAVLIAEAVSRIFNELSGSRAGVFPLGELYDPTDFLKGLARNFTTITINERTIV